MKIGPLGEELFHWIGRTDMTKLLFAFVGTIIRRVREIAKSVC
jgi:hypothetical protein